MLLIGLNPAQAGAFSLLAHEALIDQAWDDSIRPLLLKKFPGTSEEALTKARAYAYGGSAIQDMGAYPFSSPLFTELTHYVRSGDFVMSLVRQSVDVNEYAFALGALAHHIGDSDGHALAINRAVPMLYPKVAKKYGSEATYADNPAAHVMAEFGFDVVGLVKGQYAPDKFRELIGFEVSKRVLMAAFKETYGLEMDDVFGALNLAIGSYRRALSSTIPQMTRVAWAMKKDEILRQTPGLTREQFLFEMSKSEYEARWGTEYKEPGTGAHILSFFVRIVQKIGPFRPLTFRVPSREAEAVFLNGFNAALARFKRCLADEANGRLTVENVNLDLGRSLNAGAYEPADDAYAELVRQLASKKFAGVSGELRTEIVRFYQSGVSSKQAKSIQPRLAALTALVLP
jgi:hypothetical protein